MKYISQFTKKDFVDIHRKILPKVTFKENKIIIEKEDEDTIQVTYYEDWGDGNKPCFLETRYQFKDFDKLKCLDTVGANLAKNYFRYMYNRFGEEYLHDYFEYHTGIDTKKKEENYE